MANGVRSYSDDELQAILRRALERQAAQGDGFGHDELVAAAREVGLDEDAVERAIEELSHERTDAEIRGRIRKRRRERWIRHLITYLAVVGGLLGLHALGVAGAWVFWVAFGWGVGLALDTYGKLRAPTDEEVGRERERLNRHERRRRAAEARREERRRRQEERARRKDQRAKRGDASAELERVVEEGVSLLLAAAAKKLREATEQMARADRPPDTEFGRYVAQKKKGRAPREAAPRERPRVRVEDARYPHDEEEELEELEAEDRRGRRRR